MGRSKRCSATLSADLPERALLNQVAWWWMMAVLFLAVVLSLLPRSSSREERAAEGAPPLVRGSFYRWAATALTLWRLLCDLRLAVSGLRLHDLATHRAKDGELLDPWHQKRAELANVRSQPAGAGTPSCKRWWSEEDGDRWDLRSNAFHYRPPIPGSSTIACERCSEEWSAKESGSFPTGRAINVESGRCVPERLPPKSRSTRSPLAFPSPPRPICAPITRASSKRKYHDVETHKCGEQGLLSAEMKRRRGMEVSDADLEREAKILESEREKSEKRKERWEKRNYFGGSGRAKP